MTQYYIDSKYYKEEIRALLEQLSVKNILLVCGKSFYNLPICSLIENLQRDRSINITYYEDFSSNPKYEEVVQGVKVYCENGCDFILAVGGGSAIDVAKCIKLFATLKKDEDYLEQEIIENDIPLFAVPTTAGTGSEATQFAVIYVKGDKYSIEHESALPQYVLLYPDNLITLPDYQKKVTVCDALSHAVESYWSLHSSIKSRKLSEAALCLMLDHMEEYLEGNGDVCREMMCASNLAGQAINITRTTAAHAMCYKLATLYHIPHGHAVMMCLPEVWEYMETKMDACIDERGQKYLCEILDSLAGCLRQKTQKAAIQFLKDVRSKLGLKLAKRVEEVPISMMVESVNLKRLQNFPIALTKEDLYRIYQKILMETR